MNKNRWDQIGIPHKGWCCIDCIDVIGDDKLANETDYATCQMCGNEKIRYVHIMEHAEFGEQLEVGCICAVKMSGDYNTPKQREKLLKSRTARRDHWLKRKWRISRSKGNSYLNIKEHNKKYNLVVFYYKSKKRWGYEINKVYGQDTYATIDDAKLALFDDFYEKTRANT